MRHHLRQSGFSLIELMVSLALITITLFGTVKLQLFSHHALERAHYMGQALQLIEDTSVRLHLNYDLRNEYLINHLSEAAVIDCNPCSPKEMVSLDLYQLSAVLDRLFPSGEATIYSCAQYLCMRVSWMGSEMSECESSMHCIDRALL